jgi:hypothetical protein
VAAVYGVAVSVRSTRRVELGIVRLLDGLVRNLEDEQQRQAGCAVRVKVTQERGSKLGILPDKASWRSATRRRDRDELVRALTAWRISTNAVLVGFAAPTAVAAATDGPPCEVLRGSLADGEYAPRRWQLSPCGDSGPKKFINLSGGPASRLRKRRRPGKTRRSAFVDASGNSTASDA